MRNLFERLSYADSQMESAIQEMTSWLSREAQETLDLVQAGKHTEANEHIKQARKVTQGPREAIYKAMNDLLRLQGDFIAASGTV